MNLKKLMFWNHSQIENTPNANPARSTINIPDARNIDQPLTNKVIPMRSDTDNGTAPDTSTQFDQTTTQKGLFDALEINTFFDENHFGLGCHNGANYKSLEALDLGRNSLISKYQNILWKLLERKRLKISKMQIELLVIEGVSTSMSQQLSLACEHLEREIEILKHEIELANTGKGRVLQALNQYQIGFHKGLREAIDFDQYLGEKS